MQKLTTADLHSLERYARERPTIRARVLAHKQRRRVALPPYPFERRRYWVEPGQLAKSAPRSRQELTPHKKPSLDDWFYIPVWKDSVPKPFSDETTIDNWLIFTDECGVGEGIAARLRALGKDVVVVSTGDGSRMTASSYAPPGPKTTRP